MSSLLNISVAGVNMAAALLAVILDPLDEVTQRIQMWILLAMCATLVVMVGYFLRSLHQDFRALVLTVQHIDKTVTEHGATLKYHHEILHRLEDNE